MLGHLCHTGDMWRDRTWQVTLRSSPTTIHEQLHVFNLCKEIDDLEDPQDMLLMISIVKSYRKNLCVWDITEDVCFTPFGPITVQQKDLYIFCAVNIFDEHTYLCDCFILSKLWLKVFFGLCYYFIPGRISVRRDTFVHCVEDGNKWRHCVWVWVSNIYSDAASNIGQFTNSGSVQLSFVVAVKLRHNLGTSMLQDVAQFRPNSRRRRRRIVLVATKLFRSFCRWFWSAGVTEICNEFDVVPQRRHCGCIFLRFIGSAVWRVVVQTALELWVSWLGRCACTGLLEVMTFIYTKSIHCCVSPSPSPAAKSSSFSNWTQSRCRRY